jgi:hypothetical protein
VKPIHQLFWVALVALSISACASDAGSQANERVPGLPATELKPPRPALDSSRMGGYSSPDFNGQDPMFSEIDVELKYGPKRTPIIGDEITMAFVVQVKDPKWHLYSARKDGKIAYNPTVLELFPEECKGMELVGDMSEDRPIKEYEDKLLGGTIREMDNVKVTFSQRFKITGPEVTISGQFSGQYCNPGGACKFFKFPLEWNIKALK